VAVFRSIANCAGLHATVPVQGFAFLRLTRSRKAYLRFLAS
jgi:hypothetical protein